VRDWEEKAKAQHRKKERTRRFLREIGQNLRSARPAQRMEGEGGITEHRRKEKKEETSATPEENRYYLDPSEKK